MEDGDEIDAMLHQTGGGSGERTSSDEGDHRATEQTEEDEVMTDSMGKEKQPGDPKDKGLSWAQRVSGGRSGTYLRPESVVEAAFVEERMCLAFPNGEDGEAVFTIDPEVLNAMNGLWKQCIIVSVLGRRVTVPVLTKRLRELWKPKGGLSVLDLPRNFFMVRFEDEDEYLNALTGGPWRIFGSHLVVQGWDPEFDPTTDAIVTTPVWARLLNIPVNLYHETILFGLAKGIGKPVKVDPTTLNCTRARFARVCVEVNLSRPLKGTIMINGKRYFVEYEGLPMICSGCGIYGHLVHKCPRKNPPRMVTPVLASGEVLVSSGVPDMNKKEGTQNDGFTMVRGRGRRNTTEVTSESVPETSKAGESRANIQIALTGKPRSIAPGIVNSQNRFVNLGEDQPIPESQEVSGFSDANKNNQTHNDLSGKVKQVGSDHKARGTIRNRNGPGIGPKGNRAGGSLKVNNGGLKVRSNNSNKPTRGLVFGPSQHVFVSEEAGKLLHMELGNKNKSGGVSASLNNNPEDTGGADVSEPGVRRAMEMQSVSSEVLSETTLA